LGSEDENELFSLLAGCAECQGWATVNENDEFKEVSRPGDEGGVRSRISERICSARIRFRACATVVKGSGHSPQIRIFIAAPPPRLRQIEQAERI
jgi:hypothetical protein